MRDPSPERNLLDFTTDLVEGNRGSESSAWPGGRGRRVAAEAQHCELVIDRLVAAALQLAAR